MTESMSMSMSMSMSIIVLRAMCNLLLQLQVQETEGGAAHQAAQVHHAGDDESRVRAEPDTQRRVVGEEVAEHRLLMRVHEGEEPDARRERRRQREAAVGQPHPRRVHVAVRLARLWNETSQDGVFVDAGANIGSCSLMMLSPGLRRNHMSKAPRRRDSAQASARQRSRSSRCPSTISTSRRACSPIRGCASD